MKLRILVCCFVLMPLIAQASGAAFSYEGRAFNADGTPLTDSSVSFKIQVRSPGTENCLMYEETKSANLSGTNGYFTLALNDGTGTRTDSTGLSFSKVFANSGSFSLGSGCTTGTSYTPSLSDGRTLVISIASTSSGGTYEALPAIAMGAAPFSIEANQIQGFNATSLLRVQDSGVNGSAPILTTPLVNNLIPLLSGTSSLYQASSATTGTTLPSYSGAPTSPSAGSIWYNSGSNTIQYFNGSTTSTLASGGSSITALTGDVAASGSGSVASTVISVSGVSAANVASGATAAIAATNLNTASTIVKRDSSGNFSAGQVNANTLASASGSASSPAHSFSSDTGSGMWLPSTGSVAFSTSGSERLRINSSGYVGIGITSPTAPLDVNGTMRLEGTNTFYVGYYPFVYNNGSTFRMNDSSAPVNLAIFSAGSSTTPSIFVATGSGNVGIGTSSPSVKLDVAGAVNASSYSLNGVAMPMARSCVYSGATSAGVNQVACPGLPVGAAVFCSPNQNMPSSTTTWSAYSTVAGYVTIALSNTGPASATWTCNWNQ